MPIQTQFKLEGLPTLLQQLTRRAVVLDRPATRRAFREGAKIVGEEGRRQAPRSADSEEPGRLRRSIVWFLGRKGSTRRREVTAYASINVRRGRVRAPEALIIEAGRGPVMPRHKRALAMRIGRGVVFAMRSKAVAANPYFQRAFDLAGPRATQHIVDQLTRIVENGE